MDVVNHLLAWANVPFVAALALALAFALLQVTGLLGLLAGGDHDGDADGDGDGDADGDADGDDADGDDADDADHGHEGLAADLGVGKVPLSIIWQTYAVAFGLCGIALNASVQAAIGTLPALALLGSVPLALLIGFFVTKTLTRGIARVVADPRQDATSRADLLGHAGTAATRVTASWGEVRVLDRSGHVLRLVCRTRAPTPIAEGREVVFVEYDPDHDRLYVESTED